MRWISVTERMPEIVEDGESETVLCVGWKGTHPQQAPTYELMKWTKLYKPELTDYKGRPIEYGWSNRWWDTNPDLYNVHFWCSLVHPSDGNILI
jgi:hypothetical protein